MGKQCWNLLVHQERHYRTTVLFNFFVSTTDLQRNHAELLPSAHRLLGRGMGKLMEIVLRQVSNNRTTVQILYPVNMLC